MAGTDPVASGADAQDDYDDTIPTPTEADTEDTANPNPDPGDGAEDAPPAGEQEPVEGAVNEDGVPLRADGTPARDKGGDA